MTALDQLMEPLPELQSWSATSSQEAAGLPSTASLFSGGNDGHNVTRIVRQRRARAQENQAYAERYGALLVEAAELYKRVLAGNRRAALDFSEAMSTSDFPLLFGDILDRQLLGYYNVLPMPYEWISRIGTVPDFREVKRFAVDGAEDVLDNVPELTNYPAAKLTETPYSYKVTKRGRRVPLSWETRINDDLDAFGRTPQRLARAARRSEERFATSLYVGTGGPNGTFFSVGNKNLVTGNPTLSVAGLQAAMTVLASQVDTEGNPIYIEGYVLEVPPSLEVPANNIVSAIEIIAAAGGGDGTGNDQLRAKNWLAGRLRVKVNPWLPIIDQSANKNTTWYVWASPSGEGRPAMEIGFLAGHKTPEMFMKAPNQLRIGGGMADVMDGDFDSDSIEWKVRHVFGGTLMDPKMGVVSLGTDEA